MQKSLFLFALAIIIRVTPVQGMIYSQTHGTRSHSTARAASLGHTAYSRSGPSPAPATRSLSASHAPTGKTTSSRSKAYYPGITHSSVVAESTKKNTDASYRAYKAAEMKTAEEAKKKAAQEEFHSVNTRISPPVAKPKSAKPLEPVTGK